MWQTLVGIVKFLLLCDFYLGVAFGIVLFFYLWHQELKTGPNRWPAFASDRDYVILCALCAIPVVNLVAMFVAFFMVAMMWDYAPPPRRSI